jgi:hypothetical protein
VSKKKKTNPNRFQKLDDQRLFAFDPIRRSVFTWGLIAGAIGGLFIVQANLLWQFVGVFSVVFISNHHITKASRRIPRWHATILSFVGVTLAIFSVILVGSVVIAYYRTAGGTPQ